MNIWRIRSTNGFIKEIEADIEMTNKSINIPKLITTE